MKYMKKWSFLCMLLLSGVLFFTLTDNWSVMADPYLKAGAWFRREILGLPLPAFSGEDFSVSGGGDSGLTGAETDGGGDGPVGWNGSGGEVSGGNAAGNTAGADASGSPSSPEAVAAERGPEDVAYTTVEDDYFADALFIGDSRTVGMFEYGALENISTFYASTGLTVFKMFDSPIVEAPDSKDKLTIEQALSGRQFAKIYLMIGINEMGTGTVEKFIQKYAQVVEHLRELQPEAVIYLQAIMRVTAERSSQGDYINNPGIDQRNTEIEKLADYTRVFYLDVNPLICDETGGMNPEYTFDGVHLKAQYIPVWKDFLKQHAVVLD